MTAGTIPLDEIDESVWEDISKGAVCECTRALHHPDLTRCRQEPAWAVRLRHAESCASDNTLMMCQDCLNEAEKWAAGCVGYRCAMCRRPIAAISDLVGPVVAL